jgi:hypothetical protein
LPLHAVHRFEWMGHTCRAESACMISSSLLMFGNSSNFRSRYVFAACDLAPMAIALYFQNWPDGQVSYSCGPDVSIPTTRSPTPYGLDHERCVLTCRRNLPSAERLPHGQAATRIELLHLAEQNVREFQIHVFGAFHRDAACAKGVAAATWSALGTVCTPAACLRRCAQVSQLAWSFRKRICSRCDFIQERALSSSKGLVLTAQLGMIMLAVHTYGSSTHFACIGTLSVRQQSPRTLRFPYDHRL